VISISEQERMEKTQTVYTGENRRDVTRLGLPSLGLTASRTVPLMQLTKSYFNIRGHLCLEPGDMCWMCQTSLIGALECCLCQVIMENLTLDYF
jgi:hypothetical protein